MLGREARVVVRARGATPASVPVRDSGTYPVAGVEVGLVIGADVVSWSVANTSNTAVALDAVALEWDEDAGAQVAMFCNGYQSWSPTGVRIVGTAEDPSRHPNSFEFIRAVHHADPGLAAVGEARSELVTVIDFGRGTAACCLGFEGGSRHSGTIRVRRTDRGRVAVALEAWLGGAEIAPGTTRELHAVRRSSGDDPSALLDAWAARVGRAEGARVGAPYQVGWCSWYYYFHGVTETAFSDNLAHAADWPFTVFQLDDGYQHAIGDWLLTNEKFPSGVDGVAANIAARGLTPGLWIAPFLAAPSSRVANAHPEWFAREVERDEPLMGMFHPEWGGVMWELDTTREDVLEHIASTSRALVEMGYEYLKLDFTFSAAVPGRFSDPTRTPAERVRAGYDAVRAGAGDNAFILGCGCPLGAVIGSVDAMRIGPDVAPWWDVVDPSSAMPGYDAAAPSTRNAWVSTLGRSFMHRRLWLNDPDCVMLRTTDTQLSGDEARAWAYAVGVSGGLALVSDDLAHLDTDARTLLDEIITIGRAADDEACHGPAPRCSDLLDPSGPRSFAAAGYQLDADPSEPRPRFVNNV